MLAKPTQTGQDSAHFINFHCLFRAFPVQPVRFTMTQQMMVVPFFDQPVRFFGVGFQ